MNQFNILACLAMILLVAACKTEPTTEAINFTRTDNTVIARLEDDVKNIMPPLASSNYESQVFEQIYNYLISFDPRTNLFAPELVKEIPDIEVLEANDQGKYAFTFEILDEAVWADGSPVTAEDWLFTLKVVFNPLVDAVRYRAILDGEFNNLTIDPDNPKRFTMYFDQQSISGLETLTNTLPVIPAYLCDPEGLMKSYSLTDLLDGDKAEQLAAEGGNLQTFADQFNSPEFLQDFSKLSGSGPYELVAWETGQQVRLRKKTDWWGEGTSKETHPTLEAYPTEIVYKPITNPVTALAALKSEEIDVTYRIPPTDFEVLKEDSVAGERYNLNGVSSFACYFLSVNTRRPKLAEKEVRQALAYALDVDEILDKVYLNYGERITSPVHPSQPYYNKDLEVITRNVDKAKTLLSQAGWQDSNNNGIVDKEIEGELVELSIEFLYSSGRETTQNACLLMQNQAKEAGIDLQLTPSPGNVLFGNWRSGNYDLVSAGSTITPTWNPRQSWHTEGANRSGFGNADTDALIDDIIVTLDMEERIKKYNELQSIIYDEQPYIFLFAPVTSVAVHKRFDFKPFGMFPCYQPRYFKLKDEFM